jgi:hypothetical protein
LIGVWHGCLSGLLLLPPAGAAVIYGRLARRHAIPRRWLMVALALIAGLAAPLFVELRSLPGAGPPNNALVIGVWLGQQPLTERLPSLGTVAQLALPLALGWLAARPKAPAAVA